MDDAQPPALSATHNETETAQPVPPLHGLERGLGGEVEARIARSRPGAPIGNTNALKHGRRSRTRGQALKLMAMIQQAYPEWIANPKQIPEPLVALIVALAERDNSIEEALTLPKRLRIQLNQGVKDRVAQIQNSLAERGSPFPKTLENKQPTTINPETAAKTIKQ